MNFGTQYRSIEDLVRIVEEGLGIVMTLEDDGETGISYSWSEEPNEFGISFYGVDVSPTKIPDPDTGRGVLRNRFWGKYSFVIGVSDELFDFIARIRHLIARGALEVEEIPPPRV